MNIVEIIPDFGTGGAEKVVLTYMEELSKERDFIVSTIVLSNNKERLYEKRAKEEKLRIYYLNQELENNSLMTRLKQILQIRSKLIELKPDVVHIHLSILWMVCFAMIGLPIKKRFHTLHSDPRKTSYGKNRYIDLLCYRCFCVCPICLNMQMKKYADKLFARDDTLILPNGIDISAYKTNKRKEMRERLGVDDNSFVVGHVGRFHKVKNHEKIIHVFYETLKLKPDSYLVLVGDGELRTPIYEMCREMRIDERVIFTGSIFNIPEMLQAFDAFIFPSLFEGLGISLIEAQAADLHCVVSDSIPNEAIVSGKLCKLSVDEKDEIWARRLIETEKIYSSEYYDIHTYAIDSVMEKLKGYYGKHENE